MSDRAAEPQGLETPVALLVFNRPVETARVFARIAAAKPHKLLIVADGPRADRPKDALLCAEVRQIVRQVDWPCTVLTNFSDQNLGCRARVSSGLDWVFDQVEEAIILEDDCLPHPTFFQFCEELLERYRNDERVVMITGDAFQTERRWSADRYHFSAYAHVWGWATWARAWHHYDVAMRDWPQLREEGGIRDLGNGYSEAFWKDIFDRTHSGEIQTWDFQWVYACLKRGGLSVVPGVNLIENIGFGAEATHHVEANHLANLMTEAAIFPLRHPKKVARRLSADRQVFRRVFMPIPTLRNRISSRVRRAVDRSVRRLFRRASSPRGRDGQ